MAYENPTATALQDRQEVEDVVVSMEAHLRTQVDAVFQDTWKQQATFIEGLFEQYAPEVSEEKRLVAQLLGATGLTFIAERYGIDEHHPRIYSGNYEQRVLAAYHHLGHSAGFIENAFMYGTAVNKVRPGTYDSTAFLHFPIIGAYHDPIMGNGRGNDERQSAILGSEMFMRLGFLLTPDEETREGILATGWNPKRKQQSVDPTRPHLEYQVASGVSDLLPLNDRRGPYQTICCIVEDMTKKMHGQVLTRVANEKHISLAGIGVNDCLDIIDHSDTLHAAFGKILKGQTAFYEQFTPADPGLDELFPGRPKNIAFLGTINSAYAAGKIGARQALAMAKEYQAA